MKAVMVMFDSLNRKLLSPYGCNWTKTPNFQRLSEHTVKFDQCYAGSMPCMPARRELHTGRYNFLHRSWGPIEPYDDSMPQILKNNGIYTHLISDHTHYWEDGGSTYHSRYSSWENVRGQEGDKWKCLPDFFCNDESFIQNKDGLYFEETKELQKHDFVNRKFEKEESETPLARTMARGLDFLNLNHNCDGWFLQIECFDPHEPFFVPDKYKDLYPDDYEGKDIDWPPYHYVTESPLTVEHLKNKYAALLTMCDHYLGKIIDKFDQFNLWKDTMLIVNTDHGYLLGEHGWWSKIICPTYDELSHLPLFIHDPRFSFADGTSRQAIVQTIDLPATLLEFFSVPIPKDMQGRSIRPVIEKKEKIRDYALFGIHGAHVNVFDGRYVYMKAPASQSNKPLYEYTVMPMHMRSLFSISELADAELIPGNSFGFLKGCPVLKIPKGSGTGKRNFSDLLINGKDSEEARHINNNSLVNSANFGDKLYDMKEDPEQTSPLDDPDIETHMANILRRALLDSDAPEEQFERLGLPGDKEITKQDILNLHELERNESAAKILPERKWTKGGVNTYEAILRFIPRDRREDASRTIEEVLSHLDASVPLTADIMLSTIPSVVPEEYTDMVSYFCGLSGRTE